jgi:hypothetical protein
MGEEQRSWMPACLKLSSAFTCERVNRVLIALYKTRISFLLMTALQ